MSKRKSFIIGGIVGAMALVLLAATPSFQSFNTNQFGTNAAGTMISIKSGAALTNVVINGGAVTSINGITNSAQTLTTDSTLTIQDNTNGTHTLSLNSPVSIANGGTGTNTAAGARTALGIDTNLYTLTNDTRGLNFTNTNNAFNARTLVLNSPTPTSFGRQVWTNAGYWWSPDDNAFSLSVRPDHGGPGNGSEYQITANLIGIGVTEGGHIQVGVNDKSNAFMFMQNANTPQKVANSTNFQGRSFAFGWSHTYAGDGGAGGGMFHSYSTNVNQHTGESELVFALPTGNPNQLTAQVGSPGLRIGQSGNITPSTGIRLPMIEPTASTTNYIVNWTNAQFVRLDLTDNLNLINSNIALTNLVAQKDIYIFPGASTWSLATPTNWIWESESGAVTAPTNVTFSNILHINVKAMGGTSTNIIANYKLAPYTVTFDTNAQSFITAAGITVAGDKAAINKLVVSLKSHSLWTKLDAFYPLMYATSNSCSWNLVDTNAYRIAWTGGVTYDTNGITGNGTTGKGNTQFKPSTASSPKYTQNSAMIGVYTKTAAPTITKSFIGAWGDNNIRNYLQADSSTVATVKGPNNADATGQSVSFSGDFNGKFIMVSRTASNVETIYANSANGTGSVVSTGVPDVNIQLLDNYTTSSQASDATLGVAFFGSGMSAAETAQFQSDVQAFLTTIGR